MPQDVAKRPQAFAKRLQDVAKRPQDGPKKAPRRLQDGLRRPKMASKSILDMFEGIFCRVPHSLPHLPALPLPYSSTPPPPSLLQMCINWWFTFDCVTADLQPLFHVFVDMRNASTSMREDEMPTHEEHLRSDRLANCVTNSCASQESSNMRLPRVRLGS